MGARTISTMAILTALALALSFFENFIPLPIPGLKLGLANIVTVFALRVLGFRQAGLILLARCILGAIFAGNASALIFSLSGGLSALFLMALLEKSKKFSLFGISAGGAAAHNGGQILAAVIVLGSLYPVYYLPYLLLSGIATGLLTGFLSALLIERLQNKRDTGP